MDKTVQYGLLALLILFPMARGGGEPWALPVGAAFLGTLYGVWLVAGCMRGRLMIFKATYLLAPVALLVVGGIQLISNESVVGVLGSSGVDRWSVARAAGLTDMPSRISLAPDLTAHVILTLGFVMMAALLMASVFCSRRGVLRLTLGLIVMAGVQALVGFWPAMTGGRNWYSVGADRLIHGTFPNRNHFACMMGIGMLLGLGVILLAVNAKRRSRIEGAVDVKAGFNPNTFAMISLIAALVIMGTGQILSLSRAGTMSTALGLCVLGIYGISRHRRKWRGYACGIGGLATLLAGASEGVDRLSGRYERLVSVGNLGMIGRISVWKDTWTMLMDYGLTGVGMGAFEVVSPRYETGFSPDRITVHAHNDWLELLAEIGLPLGVIVIGITLWLLLVAWRRVLSRREPTLKWLGVAAVASCSVIAIHELVEFNLRMPALVLALSGVVTVVALCCRLPGGHVAVDAKANCFDIPFATSARIGVGILSMAGVVFLVWCSFPYVIAGRAESKLLALVSPDVARVSRMNPEARSKYCITLADEILAVRPASAFALRQKAEHGTYVLQCESIRAADAGMTEEFMVDAQERLSALAGLMSAACRRLPTHGHYHAMCAMAVEQAGLFDDGVDEARVAAMFRVAHENSPNVGYVTYLCANGAWRRFLRAEPSDGADEELRREALTLYRETIRQSPARAQRIYRTVWAVIPDPELIETLAPDSLAAHEQLYQLFLKMGMFEECAKQLLIMSRLNESRLTVADSDTLTVYDMGRISRRSRDQVAASIITRQAFTLGMLGEWSARAELVRRESGRMVDAMKPKLATARKVIASGQSVRAGTLLRNILANVPSCNEATIEYARLLRTSGRYRDCADTLATLLYRSDPDAIDLDDLRAAMTVAESLQPLYPKTPGQFPMHRFVHHALHVLIGAKERGATVLKTAEAGLVELSTDLADGTYEWMQEPMVHFYLGRCREALNDREGAVTTYVAIVKRFPDHWYTYERLLQLAETDGAAVPVESLNAARAMRDRLMKGPPVNATFGGTITLLSCLCDTPLIERKDRATVRYHCLCVGNVTQNYGLYLQFRNGGKLRFSSRIHPGSGGARDTLGWRVGEMITLEHTLNPAKLSAQAKTRLSPGPYDVEIRIVLPGQVHSALKSAIPARLPIFEVVESEPTNKP